MRLIARLRAWLSSHWYGSDQIAVSSEGREVIGEEDWAKLPEGERSRWERMDESSFLYRRKPW
jgi:hypothetical protein